MFIYNPAAKYFALISKAVYSGRFFLPPLSLFGLISKLSANNSKHIVELDAAHSLILMCKRCKKRMDLVTSY